MEYEQRLKSEIVAYALEGRGKVDITHLRKNGDHYEFRDLIPVQVRVNLPEKVSRWDRFRRFLGIKGIETKKEKAERISIDDLNREKRLEAIRRNTARMVERENMSQTAREKIRQANEGSLQSDHEGDSLLRS